MIQDFFIRKENIAILSIAGLSAMCVILGFVFLSFKSGQEGPREIPNSIEEIKWKKERSNVLNYKLEYPEHLFFYEYNEKEKKTVNITLQGQTQSLDQFANENHVSFYPNGVESDLFYGNTREDTYTSQTGNTYKRIEFLTTTDEVWGVMLTPEFTWSHWQPWGFIWIRSKIQGFETKCFSSENMVVDIESCTPYEGDYVVPSGVVDAMFIETAYELLNHNEFK